MSFSPVSIWKKNPFLRLVLPFISGIIIQWYHPFSLLLWQLILGSSWILFTGFFFIPFFNRYKFSIAAGLFVMAIFIAGGAILAFDKDIRHNNKWFGKFDTNENALFLTLDEKLVEKTNSFKANAVVNYVFINGNPVAVTGTIILYFPKDAPVANLNFGSRIVIKKKLQPIKNTGNPGSFDYKRYCLFQQLTHQVFLKPGEYVILNGKDKRWLATLVNTIREKVLEIIRNYIPGDKERGLAEALLIGYRDDLDKAIVQSYTHTGVVHIIAISGMHLGLVYWLLVLLSKPLQRKKSTKWSKPVLVISGLWLFSLLAGAQPSVLRSAVMFSCIVTGESMGKKSSVYNSLAASAFILLCYNPYWLWDVGFQLSFAAVLSIVIFTRPVYNWFYVKNRLLDFIWKMNAVTIAAQVLTIPFSIYHFHQFPNFFLLTNLLAVPLSSLIVLGEILLCVTSLYSPLAFLTGKMLYGLIKLMNVYVERIDSLPFSLWEGLQISLIQAILLLITFASISFWLLERKRAGLTTGLVALICFVLLRSVSFMEAENHEKIIVYNVPRRQAVDLIDGRHFFFAGDSELIKDRPASDFHLKPSRTLYRVSGKNMNYRNSPYIVHGGLHIFILDTTKSFATPARKDTIDLLIMSKNPKIYMGQLTAKFVIKQVVFDGSASALKIKSWKKDCDSLHIPWYDVAEKGAFVMSLP